MTAVLEIIDLHVAHVRRNGWTSAVSGVSLQVAAGEILGLVGESGCGKTTLGLSILGLLPRPARISGEIRFRGLDLLRLPESELRALRGDRIALVPQDPLGSLDPTWAVGSQVAESILAHRRVSRQEARARAVELMRDVGIPAPERRYRELPHRFSGGMRQRAVIAAALANHPDLLIADEPTTALDVTIQAQVLALMRSVRERFRSAMIVITHDLGVVAALCDRVAVMYAGQLVELGPTASVLGAPTHPYTVALRAAMPSRDRVPGLLRAIEGDVPDLRAPPAGCRFAPRCPLRMPACRRTPGLVEVGTGHRASCWALVRPESVD